MSAPTFAIFPLVLGLIAVACVAVGIYLIVTSRREIIPGPRCRHCDYNLTGSTTNRCPECGRLFFESFEASVVTNPLARQRKRRRIGIALLVMSLIYISLGLGGFLGDRTHRARMQAARAKGMAAGARYLAKQRARAQAAAQSQPTTAPASESRP